MAENICMTLREQIQKIKPGVSKRILLLVAAGVWGFAGYNIIRLGTHDLIRQTHNLWLMLLGAALIFALFFKFIFLKMYRKHLVRIVNNPITNPCLFSFFDVKSYLIMALMITGGVALRRSHLLPPAYLGTFYLGLGVALVSAALCFLCAAVRLN